MNTEQQITQNYITEKTLQVSKPCVVSWTLRKTGWGIKFYLSSFYVFKVWSTFGLSTGKPELIVLA
jgi:hypothetical protein